MMTVRSAASPQAQLEEAPYEATASQRAIHRSMLDLHSAVVQDAQAV